MNTSIQIRVSFNRRDVIDEKINNNNQYFCKYVPIKQHTDTKSKKEGIVIIT